MNKNIVTDFEDNFGVGSVWTNDNVAKALNISVEEVMEKVNDNQILSLTTSDKIDVFPCFQFEKDEKGNWRVFPELIPVLEILTDDVISRWTLVSWLQFGNQLFNEVPAEILRSDPQLIYKHAQEIAYRRGAY